jgi:hypothetical protein
MLQELAAGVGPNLGRGRLALRVTKRSSLGRARQRLDFRKTTPCKVELFAGGGRLVLGYPSSERTSPRRGYGSTSPRARLSYSHIVRRMELPLPACRERLPYPCAAATSGRFARNVRRHGNRGSARCRSRRSRAGSRQAASGVSFFFGRPRPRVADRTIMRSEHRRRFDDSVLRFLQEDDDMLSRYRREPSRKSSIDSPASR